MTSGAPAARFRPGFVSVIRDCSYAWRMLLRNGRFTALVAVTLALTIGASTTVFSIANAVLLRPLPYADSSALVWLKTVRDQGPLEQRASYPDFRDWREQTRTLDLVGHGGAIDADLPVDNVATLERRLADSLAQDRFRAGLLGAFSSLALALAAVGLFAVLSYMTARRVREIGIRMALGARAAEVARAVVVDGMLPVIGGILLGAVGAALLFRLVDNLLFEVAATDPMAFAVAIAIMLAVAALACAVPARRVARTDPAAALRGE